MRNVGKESHNPNRNMVRSCKIPDLTCFQQSPNGKFISWPPPKLNPPQESQRATGSSRAKVKHATELHRSSASKMRTKHEKQPKSSKLELCAWECMGITLCHFTQPTGCLIHCHILTYRFIPDNFVIFTWHPMLPGRLISIIPSTHLIMFKRSACIRRAALGDEQDEEGPITN